MTYVKGSSADVYDTNTTFAIIVQQGVRQRGWAPVARQQRRVAIDGAVSKRRDEASGNKESKGNYDADVPSAVAARGAMRNRGVAHAFSLKWMVHLERVRAAALDEGQKREAEGCTGRPCCSANCLTTQA